jgi:hypothetical protein
MEQLIPLIDFVKKNHFWLICGTVAIASIVTWYLAAGSLHQQRTKWQGEIDGRMSAANNIIKTGAEGIETPVAHPNEYSQKGMEGEIDKASTALLKAWKMRREAQEDVLVWPDVSNKDFLDLFTTLQPAEKFIDQLVSPEVNLDTSLRVYQAEIPDRMDEICKIIGTKWEHGKRAEKEKEAAEKKSSRVGDDAPSAAGIEEIDSAPGVVKWNESNQELWNQKLTEFKGRDGQNSMGGVPTPIQVIALQQDLWLLEAMYNIIKDVNGEADANDLAVIKRIDHVVFGREARKQLGTLSAPDSQLAPSGTKVKNTGIPTEGRGTSGAFGTGRQRLAKGEFDVNPGAGFEKYGPFHGRYVNADFSPIPAKDLYDALNSETLPKDNLELLVAKRVPVRIAVRMNNEKIDDFIAACANSDFAFEVKQVRIGKKSWEEIQLAGIKEDENAANDRNDEIVRGESMGSGGGGGMNLSEETGENSSSGGGSDAAEEARPPHLRTTLDVNVEFFGIVKIYNPVDEEVILGKKKDTAKPNPNPNP